MKLKEAMDIINKKPGYIVHFEWIKGGFLEGDHFPEVTNLISQGEPPIETEEEAWELARKFAAKTRGKTCNFHVGYADFSGPVAGYKEREIKNR